MYPASADSRNAITRATSSRRRSAPTGWTRAGRALDRLDGDVADTGDAFEDDPVHRRLHHTGAYRVHAHAPARPCVGERPRQREQPRLARAVGGASTVLPVLPATEATLTTAAPTGRTSSIAWSRKKTARTFTAWTTAQSFSLTSPIRERRTPPAAFTSAVTCGVADRAAIVG